MCAPQPSGVNTVISNAPRPTTRRWTGADGLNIVGDVFGQPGAPVVVLLHGGGQTRHSWSAAVKPLASAGYCVVGYDLRGHGNSDWSPEGRYALQDHAGDLKGVLSELAGPCALVGASLGGLTALQAVAEGLRPHALVLVDIVLSPDPAGIARIRDFMRASPGGFATVAAAADAVAAYNTHRTRSPNPSGLMKNLRLRADGRYHWHWDPAMLSAQAATGSDQLARLTARMRAAPRIPTRLLRGRHSDVVTDAGVEALRDVLPDVDVVDVTDAGHMVAGDNNDAFTGAILQFLARHLPGRS